MYFHHHTLNFPPHKIKKSVLDEKTFISQNNIFMEKHDDATATHTNTRIKYVVIFVVKYTNFRDAPIFLLYLLRDEYSFP